MSVDKQDLIENEEQCQDSATPRYSAYGPAAGLANPRVSIHEKRASYTAYAQPSPFDDISRDGFSPIDDPFSLHTDTETQQHTDQHAHLVEPLHDYTAQAVLVAAFCCLPFGVHAFMKAKEAKYLYETGHGAAAVEASKKAARSVKIGIVLGCTLVLPVLITITVLLIVLL